MFQVRPKNIYGECDPSLPNVLTYIASQIPDKPNTLVTTLFTSINVKIQWDPPFANYKAIDKYQIMIADNSGTNFIETTSLCDGSKT